MCNDGVGTKFLDSQNLNTKHSEASKPAKLSKLEIFETPNPYFLPFVCKK